MKNGLVEKLETMNATMYTTKTSVENGSMEKIERGEKILSKVAVSLIAFHPHPNEEGARASKKILEEVISASEWFMIPVWKEQLKAEFLKEKSIGTWCMHCQQR